MTITKVVSGLIAICASCAVRPFRAVSGAVATLLPRPRFAEGPEGFVDGATYEFLHDGGSVCVRTFFADYDRAEKHDRDSFTWWPARHVATPTATHTGTTQGWWFGELHQLPACSPTESGIRSFQKHYPSGEPCGHGVGAWQNACNFFGPDRTARIRLA